MRDAPPREVAFYARHGGHWAQWYTLLHPPYTAWHLSYVLIGASLASHVDVIRLTGTLVAFFLAVGVAAHALDEIHGRPLHTTISDATLIATAVLALLGACGIAAAATPRLGVSLIPIAAVGVALVPTYNLELFTGRLHTAIGFAVSWGAYPVVVGYYAQTGSISVPAAIAATAAMAVSAAQRELSSPARMLRRRARDVDLHLTLDTGTIHLAARDLLRPLEGALRALSWGVCLLGVALILAHWR